MDETTLAKLTQEIKLNVLMRGYGNDALDANLKKDVAQGVAFVSRYFPAGVVPDFEGATLERMLLDNYVLYAQSNAVDDFVQNYAQEISELKQSKEAQQYAKERATS